MDKVNPNGHSKANLKLVRVNGVFTFYRRWGLAVNSSELLSLEEDIFQYAKKNLAVVNVYIKARDFFAHLYYLQHRISALPLIRLSCQSTLSRELGDAH